MTFSYSQKQDWE